MVRALMKKKKGFRVLSLCSRMGRVSAEPKQRRSRKGSLLIDVDAIRAHERKVELDRLEVENLEVDVASAGGSLRLGDLLRLVGEFAVEQGASVAVQHE
jgi:hypothetical protein